MLIPRRTRPRRAQRKGNYAVLFVLAIPVVIGFGALALDTSYIRLAQSQTQDVADAASQAALLELRRTSSTVLAQEAAEDVVGLNVIAGEAGTLTDLQFGAWDQDAPDDGSDRLVAAAVPNAARAFVAREGDKSIPLFLSKIWGYNTFEVERFATSASRKLQVVVVMDITNSWSPNNFDKARDAAVQFFDTISGSHGPQDQIGMTIFTNRFGWEFTPLIQFNNAAEVASTRSEWDNLRTASKAGVGPSTWPGGCSLNGGTKKNDFTDPAGGCFANMPREYRDEPGTDHTTGMQMAWTMFDDGYDPTAFRVMVVLTDGQPNGLGNAGTARATDGYTETRWREFAGPVNRNAGTIREASVTMTNDMWDDMQVHTYVVSFREDQEFLSRMPQGQGYYVNTNDASALVPIFQDIANSLPLALVE